jgi:hypothetical protein
VPRVRPPKLTSPAERKEIANGAAELDFAHTLEALGIAAGDKRRAGAHAMLSQIAENHLVIDAVAGPVKDRNVREGVEETPAGQIETLKAARRRVKAQEKQGLDPNPFFPHPCKKPSRQEALPIALEDYKEPRHRAALSMAMEMDIARELHAIELATPELSMVTKLVAAIDAAIDRLEGAMSTGRKHDWARDALLDQLEAVAGDLAPDVVADRKRLWEFIIAFMDVMGMKRPDIESNRSRADKLLTEGRAEQRRKMLKTKQARVDVARWR